MNKENKVLMAEARSSLKGNWVFAVVVFVVYLVITACVSKFLPFGKLIGFIITGPLVYGISLCYLSIAREKECLCICETLLGFKFFFKTFFAYLFMFICIILWMCVFIVPGIMAIMAYSMTFFILIDNPKMGSWRAIRTSSHMMKGNKWKFFCLIFRFFWWWLLGIVTCGIAFLWIVPYMQVSYVKFYDDLKGSINSIEEVNN